MTTRWTGGIIGQSKAGWNEVLTLAYLCFVAGCVYAVLASNTQRPVMLMRSLLITLACSGTTHLKSKGGDSASGVSVSATSA